MDPQHALLPLVQRIEHIIWPEGLLDERSGNVSAITMHNDHGRFRIDRFHSIGLAGIRRGGVYPAISPDTRRHPSHDRPGQLAGGFERVAVDLL